jgi:hypothetical protein
VDIYGIYNEVYVKTILAEVVVITIVEDHLLDTAELVLHIMVDVVALITMTMIVIDVIQELHLTAVLVVDLTVEGIAQEVPIIADVARVLIIMIMEEEVRVHMGMF